MNHPERDAPRPPPAAWLFTGRVMHERLRPRAHRFVYPLFQVRCDLARLASLDSWWFGVNRFAPLAIYARDYGPRDGSDLDTWMRSQLSDAGLPADGAIWLHTLPRVFGYAFNPVSFWYCHDRDGALRALYAEVRNTFGERHGYLLGAAGGRVIDASTPLVCRKVLHVSPFCRVEGGYTFRVREPSHAPHAHDARRSTPHAVLSIDYFDADGLLIRTALAGRLRPLTRAAALGALVRQPLLTLGVVARIYWQALRLALKKTPFYGKHPEPRITRPSVDAHRRRASSIEEPHP